MEKLSFLVWRWAPATRGEKAVSSVDLSQKRKLVCPASITSPVKRVHGGTLQVQVPCMM